MDVMYCTFANGMFGITELTKAVEMQLKITNENKFPKIAGMCIYETIVI